MDVETELSIFITKDFSLSYAIFNYGRNLVKFQVINCFSRSEFEILFHESVKKQKPQNWS